MAELKLQVEFDKEMEIALRRIKESPLAKFLTPNLVVLSDQSQGELLLSETKK